MEPKWCYKPLTAVLVPHFLLGWCYFPSIGTEIKCNNSLFSVRTDGNLQLNFATENSGIQRLISVLMNGN